MIIFLVITLCLIACIIAIFNLLWAWLIVFLPVLFLLYAFASVKLQKWKHIPELSPQANYLFGKFGHFYTMQHAARIHSSSASAVQFTGIIIAIIGAFHGFWWGFGFAVALWFGMGYIAFSFNPTHYLKNVEHKIAHEEILSYMQEGMERNFEQRLRDKK